MIQAKLRKHAETGQREIKKGLTAWSGTRPAINTGLNKSHDVGQILGGHEIARLLSPPRTRRYNGGRGLPQYHRS